MRWVWLPLWISLLSCLGCRPIVEGDPTEHPLLGEWRVVEVQGGSPNADWGFSNIAFRDSESVWRYHSTYRGDEGTYTLEGDRVTVRLHGDSETYTVLRRSEGFDLRHELSRTTFVLEPDSQFEGLAFAGALLLGLVGLGILLVQAEALRVYVCSRSWPEVAVEVTSAEVAVEHTAREVSQATREEQIAFDVDHGAVTDTVRSKSYTPQVQFSYATEDGRVFEGTNEADYNRGLSYSKDQAEALVERWRRDGLRVRYNPRDPVEVFLGREHFPLFSTLLLTLVGSALAPGLAAAFGQLVELLGYRVIKVGTIDWTALAVLAALPLYLLVARLFAR